MDTKGKAKRGELLIVGGIIFLAILLVVSYGFVSTSTLYTTWTQVYLDDIGNVHVVTDRGQDIQ